jgi:tyrosyl-tRNA synthetase
VPDELIAEYRRLTLDFFADPAEADRVADGLSTGALNPWGEKRRMAREVVDLYHGAGAGAAAEARFETIHRDRELPQDVMDLDVPQALLDSGRLSVPGLLVALGLADSRSEARRMMRQGGVRLDGVPVEVEDLAWREDLIGSVWSVGRRKFARLAGFEGP